MTTSQDEHIDATAHQLSYSLQPFVIDQIKKNLKTYSRIFKDENRHYDLLFFFFGLEIADGYRPGNKNYFDTCIEGLPQVLSKWIHEQIVSHPQMNRAHPFSQITHGLHKVRSHMRSLTSLGPLHPLCLNTVFYPAVQPFKFKGLVHYIRSEYSLFPLQALRQAEENDFFSLLFEWIDKTVDRLVLVSLYDGKHIDELHALQEQRLLEHQKETISSMLLGYSDARDEINSGTPHYYTSQRQSTRRITQKNVRFISYETFMHLRANGNTDDTDFAAEIILEQLHNDYHFSGIDLSPKHLGLILRFYINGTTDSLMISEPTEATFYHSELGKNILLEYIKKDQVHNLVLKHKMDDTQRDERVAWHKNLNDAQLPMRLQGKIRQLNFSYHEMFILMGERNVKFTTSLKSFYHGLGYTWDGLFSTFARLLLDAGGNVKHVLKAYERFCFSPYYLNRYPLDKSRFHYTIDLVFMHDFYSVLHPEVCRFYHELSHYPDKTSAKKIVNITLKALLSYNLNTTNNLAHLTKLLSMLRNKFKNGILMHADILQKISRQSDLHAIITLCEDMELQQKDAVLFEVLSRFSVKKHHIRMSSNMLVKDLYIKFYLDFMQSESSSFHEEPRRKEIVQAFDNFSVGVLDHKNPLSHLGPGVNGVCIPLGGEHHLSQISPSFMNLCVYTEKKVILWGLLCRAHNNHNTKEVYILNNFQGSINDKKISPKEVQKAVIAVLKEFVTINKIDSVLMKQQFFNAIDITVGLPKNNVRREMYQLETTVRLDFEISEEGRLREENFFIL